MIKYEMKSKVLELLVKGCHMFASKGEHLEAAAVIIFSLLHYL